MIIDIAMDLVEQIVRAAILATMVVDVVNDGLSPARFVARDPETGCVFGAYVAAGDSMLVNRGYRLLIESIDDVAIRSMVEVGARWSTQ